MSKRATDPSDPNRCQGLSKSGQCWNLAEAPSKFCLLHGGSIAAARAEERRIYKLNQSRFQQRLWELKDHEELKSLREEIGLCRILIESRFNAIKNEADLLAACSMINTMLLTLERLVNTTHKIEQNLGQLLSKPTIVVLTQNIVQILSEELQTIDNFEHIIDRTCERLLTVIDQSTNIDPK